MDLLGIIGAILGGGAIGVWLKFLIDRRKLSGAEQEAIATRKRSDFDRALQVVTEQRDDALELVKDCREKLELMDMEVQGLRLARDLDPFPNWVVSLEGKYLYVNREFEKEFLEPQGRTYRAVIGETHESGGIWPEAFCRLLKTLDVAARRVPDGHAKAKSTLEIDGIAREVTVHKFTIRIRGAIVCFAGYITDLEAPQDVIG